ncbi:hypothetical protein DL93DRAFT_2164976 [Clavulina sp. PMI_390]|nr:hypothetical protein DL93DRAFT_2164976 [Clavulina sp. PMI_390]
MESSSSTTITEQQPSIPIAAPRPRLPHHGILMRSPSTDSVKHCVKFAQCDPQIFEIESWDRSPCPVTPKLTYRDLVELKQLELDKVPLSPFKSLADLPMPIGLPRVRVGLQPIFDSPPKSPSASPSSSSSSIASSVPAPALHPNTPTSTPLDTPPRTQSPQPGSNVNSPSGAAAPTPARNGNPYNGNSVLMMRRSYSSSSASRLAKTTTPSSTSSPAPAASHIPPPVPLSYATGTSTTTISSSGATTAMCHKSSPLSQPPSTSPSPTDPAFVPLPTSPTSPASGSHPALDLASTLLSQRTPGPLNDSAFPDALRTTTTTVSTSPPKATLAPPSNLSAAQQKLAKKMGGFQFMPLLNQESTPSSSVASSVANSVEPTPAPSPIVPATPQNEPEAGAKEEPAKETETETASQPTPIVTLTKVELLEPSHDDEHEADHEDTDDEHDRPLVMSRTPAPGTLRFKLSKLPSAQGDADNDSPTSPEPHSRPTKKTPRAPPSEANTDTDTESTLHSEFDHHDMDLDMDVDMDTRTEVDEHEHMVGEHEMEDDPLRREFEGEFGYDLGPRHGHEEPVEPDEPHEPDLSLTDGQSGGSNSASTATITAPSPSYFSSPSSASLTPTQTSEDLELGKTTVKMFLDGIDTPTSSSTSTSPGNSPPHHDDAALPALSPKDKEQQALAKLRSLAASPSADLKNIVVVDQDVFVRMSTARAMVQKRDGVFDDARPSALGDRVLTKGKLTEKEKASAEERRFKVTSPPATPDAKGAMGGNAAAAATSAGPLSPTSPGSAWENVAW